MNRTIPLVAGALVMTAYWSNLAPAQTLAGATAVLLGQFGDWGAYTHVQNGRRKCFALSKRVSRQSDQTKSLGKDTFLLIDNRPSENVWNEISVTMDYTFGSNSGATIQIDNATFTMYTQGDGAWIKNAVNEEARVLNLMRGTASIIIKGTSARGTKTVDQYSALGIGQAIDRAKRECLPALPTVPPVAQPTVPSPGIPGNACDRFPNLC